MSFLRGASPSGGKPGSDGHAVKRLVEQRHAARSDRLCSGTMSCSQCDAPVALGGGPRALSDRLSCPFCGHQAVAREFLSLGSPTRPARVVVRVRRPALPGTLSGCPPH